MSVPSTTSAEPTLPWDEFAERAVLGAVLLEADALDAALELLKPQDFHRVAHRTIFESFIDLLRRGESIDPVTVLADLSRKGELERSGGAGYVGSLIDSLPRTTNVSDYAKIVRDRSLLRQVLVVADEIRTEAAGATRPAIEVLDAAEGKLFQLSDAGRRSGFRPLADIAGEGMDQIELMSRQRLAITGLGTGYDRLDKMTSGMQAGDLIILAARPSMGKTALALNIAQNAAIMHGATIGVFSLEMSSGQLFQRLLAGESRVELQKIRSGNLDRGEWDQLNKAYETLSSARMYIDDTPGIGPMEVRAKARRLKHDAELGLIVVDYLQLMRLETRPDNRQQEVAEISRSLKAIAKELQVPVLALSQLSRAPDTSRGSDHRPQLSDLRESGAIEQDADLVMFIYRPEVYEKDKEKVAALGLEGQAEVIIAKQRNGPTGIAKLFFVKQYTRFENQDDSFGGF